MAVTAIPRIVVKLGLGSVRLPLSIAERLGARSGLDLAGSPLVALYDELEGQAKQALGRWIADDQLVAEGRRQTGASHSRREAGQEEGQGQGQEDDQDLERRRAELRQEEERARAEAEERAAEREEAVRRAARSRARAAEARRRQRELARQRAQGQPSASEETQTPPES